MNNYITGDVVNFGLQGGLGNQLFCVSTVLANSYEHNLIPFLDMMEGLNLI